VDPLLRKGKGRSKLAKVFAVVLEAPYYVIKSQLWTQNRAHVIGKSGSYMAKQGVAVWIAVSGVFRGFQMLQPGWPIPVSRQRNRRFSLCSNSNNSLSTHATDVGLVYSCISELRLHSETPLYQKLNQACGTPGNTRPRLLS
jgi:hypothetical protein